MKLLILLSFLLTTGCFRHRLVSMAGQTVELHATWNPPFDDAKVNDRHWDRWESVTAFNVESGSVCVLGWRYYKCINEINEAGVNVGGVCVIEKFKITEVVKVWTDRHYDDIIDEECWIPWVQANFGPKEEQ